MVFQSQKILKDAKELICIDLDNPNRLILTETWESRDDHAQYIKFIEDEGPDGILAYIVSVLDGDKKISWATVKGTWH